MNLDDLYQEIILDHGRKPRNHREMPDATHGAEGFNPMCGDRIKLTLRVADGRIEDAAFTGCGCAISQASASMLTQAVKGQSVGQAEDLFSRFHRAVTGKDAPEGDLGCLEALLGVQQFPNRVKCATLAWHAMREALEGPDA
ncbi:MAG: SUF system NifU family Fe-S cluster assembly protein [Fimbriimonadaceae bacterium]|nr:SUF system NifU family Fe-S cluster assembly protein [Fimbriimonadaceae bacterium]QYK57911.1 MAG: SUF system NifU family Fe-S cluster assembly protein [Fimbriimonadaceae bacterium]